MDAVDVDDDGVQLVDGVVIDRGEVGEHPGADLAQCGLLADVRRQRPVEADQADHAPHPLGRRRHRRRRRCRRLPPGVERGDLGGQAGHELAGVGDVATAEAAIGVDQLLELPRGARSVEQPERAQRTGQPVGGPLGGLRRARGVTGPEA